MSTVNIDAQLFDLLSQTASDAKVENTIDLLPEERRQTAYLFLAALACRSEEEYETVKKLLEDGQPLNEEFKDRLALVTRAFCVGHDWVLNNWGLWNK